MVTLCTTFWRNANLCFQSSCTILHPQTQQWKDKPIQKWTKDLKDNLERRYSGGQAAHEKLFTITNHSVQFSSVQSLSRVQLFVILWIAARQASLSITNSRSSPKLMSIKSVMPSNHLILCRPLLLLTPIPPSIRVFSNESILDYMNTEVAKVLESQPQHQPFQWTPNTGLL